MTNSSNRLVAPPVPVAPIYSGRRSFFLRTPVRIPPPVDLKGLQNARPFWIPIFDTATLTTSGIAGGALLAQQTAENNFIMTVDFAWLASIFSVGVIEGGTHNNGPGSSPTLAFQMQRTWIDPQGNEQTYLYQKTPIQAENFFGVNQAAAPAGVGMVLPGSTAFYLRKPTLFRAGDEMLVRVQNLATSSVPAQLVLFGYIEGK